LALCWCIEARNPFQTASITPSICSAVQSLKASATPILVERLARSFHRLALHECQSGQSTDLLRNELSIVLPMSLAMTRAQSAEQHAKTTDAH
jgi:hypothetical protein